MDETLELTPEMLGALRGIQEFARPDGWATERPAEITRATVIRCLTEGLLEQTIISRSGKTGAWSGTAAYRVTEKGMHVMAMAEGANAG